MRRAPSAENAKRLSIFDADRESDAFNDSIIDALRIIQRASEKQLFSEENIQRFKHGTSWAQRVDINTEVTEMKRLSAEVAITFSDLVNNDLTLINSLLTSVSQAMQRQFWQMLYSTVDDACERSGNVVDAKKSGSLAASFLEMLEKVEFGVDRTGNISIPQIHASPQMAEKMLTELHAQPPAFKEKVEKIKAEKTAAALEAEAARRSRFKAYRE